MYDLYVSYLFYNVDVLLLCDVFEHFRKTAIDTYKLDPANYYTLPGLSWDALLRISKVHLDLLSDVDVHQFIEHRMRGGVSMVSQRYAKANNPQMEDFDNSKPTTYLQYLDANNLYGWAMSQYLPVGEFAWEQPSAELFSRILAHPDNHHHGYILECDLSIPPTHHDLLADYPVAPEKLCVKQHMLSPYQLHLIEKLKVEDYPC